MIKTIEIRGFQSHQHTKLTLHPGVNAIVGMTDSGKTAVLRALQWLVFNRPSGDEFVSHQGGETSVTVVLDDGMKIVRRRKPNCYEVDGVRLSAVGRSVPDEITSALRLSEINFQGQMDAPFLVSDSPGDVARQLNDVAGIDAIDSVQSFVRTAQRDARARVGQQQAELDNYRRLIRDVKPVESIAPDVKALRALTADAVTRASALDDINGALARLRELRRELTIEGALRPILALAAELKKCLGTQYELKERLRGLHNVVDDFEASRRFGIEQATLETERAKWESQLPKTCPTCGAPLRGSR